jgi:hypothetical protein
MKKGFRVPGAGLTVAVLRRDQSLIVAVPHLRPDSYARYPTPGT